MAAGRVSAGAQTDHPVAGSAPPFYRDPPPGTTGPPWDAPTGARRFEVLRVELDERFMVRLWRDQPARRGAGAT